MSINFSVKKTPVEMIKEGPFVGNYFRDIYSFVNSKWYKNHGKNLMNSMNLMNLKNIDKKYYFSSYHDVNVDKNKVKCGTTLRFCENNGWINSLDPYGWF